jgi:hypothetical protein
MSKLPQFARPTFAAAITAWETLLSERKLPTEMIWIFDENLCFEKDAAGRDGFKLGYQTQFTPTPPEAEQIAFDYFCEFEARLVFYRIGSSRGRSVCLMLCDEFFESKGGNDGYVRRDEWLVSFHPGIETEIEEITDRERWKQRILRNRPLHDLDFCMTHRAVHEILAHGRVLTAYEHYALRFLHGWSRMFGHKR